ncbi:hypothetical protein Slin15195_G086380 [Septoria linicola]|uniref:Uncharacterized protein n=1 Tax=Septoria linicola TaxID=215465 RepID=A0A9Q9EMC1_9PEZI|nr:hypothetical protein Slin14017_G088970 [Septoria linicola]USW55319.1 hypothetical protein Slin15195_G086380 [Septoria linicola]
MTESEHQIPFWASDSNERYTLRYQTRQALLAAAPKADVPEVPSGPYDTMSSWSTLDNDIKSVLPRGLWQIHQVSALSPTQSHFPLDLPLHPARRSSPSATACHQILDPAMQQVDYELEILPSSNIFDRSRSFSSTSSLSSSDSSIFNTTLPTPHSNNDSAIDLSCSIRSPLIPSQPTTIGGASTPPAFLMETTIPPAMEEETPGATKSHIFILHTNVHHHQSSSGPQTLSSRPPISIRHLSRFPVSNGSSGGGKDLWRQTLLFDDQDKDQDQEMLDLGDWGQPWTARTWRSSEGRRMVDLDFLLRSGVDEEEQYRQESGRRARARSMLRKSVLKLRRLSRIESGT